MWVNAHAAWQVSVDGYDEKVAARDRIREWSRYPNVVTPFPMPGEEPVLPCNAFDLVYYGMCHRGYTSVRAAMARTVDSRCLDGALTKADAGRSPRRAPGSRATTALKKKT